MVTVRREISGAGGMRALLASGPLGGLSDAELLGRFATRREEAAFEEIIRRHGPMAWGVCLRVLRDRHDAEDAFQATFLVLARKAASVVPREKLGPWLHGVAFQTARKARGAASRRSSREETVADLPEPEVTCRVTRDDDLAIFDEELRRLPEKYRAPVVLCELEGKTHRQAAEELGWPIGTVSGRLSRARAMLADRLSRRGVSASGGLLAALLSQGPASAAVPRSLAMSTARAAIGFAAGHAATGAGSAKVAALVDDVMKGMLMTKLKVASAVVLVAVAALGVAASRPLGLGQKAEASDAPKDPGAVPAKVDPPSPQVRPGIIAADDEIKALEGTWSVVETADKSERKTAAQKPYRGLGRVVIKGNQMTFHDPDEPKTYCLRFDVDPTQNPKIIGMIGLDEEKKDVLDEAISLGIYERKGDTLTICMGVDRPTGFEILPGSTAQLIVLKWAMR